MDLELGERLVRCRIFGRVRSLRGWRMSVGGGDGSELGLGLWCLGGFDAEGSRL